MFKFLCKANKEDADFDSTVFTQEQWSTYKKEERAGLYARIVISCAAWLTISAALANIHIGNLFMAVVNVLMTIACSIILNHKLDELKCSISSAINYMKLKVMMEKKNK